MTNIALLRHAAVPIEYQKRHIGHSDIDLDMNLFEYEKIEELKTNFDFDIVYSSDLKRCVNTVKQVSNEYICDSRLREVKFKSCIEGKTFEEIEQNKDYKKEYLESMNAWYSYICEESLESFKLRIENFIADLPKNKNILICSHAGTIRMLHSILQEKEFEYFLFKLDYLDVLIYNLNL